MRAEVVWTEVAETELVRAELVETELVRTGFAWAELVGLLRPRLGV